MRDIVLQHVSRSQPLRVLDLGCGTGSLVMRLVAALPLASVTGIDISAANIAAAERQRDAIDRDRARFVVADYLSFCEPPFDVIVCDGVLHLIPAATKVLIRKIGEDLAPDGVFVCDMPYECTYNRIFAVIRRLLRAIRGPLTDRAILAAARLVHARDMSEEGLHERVSYMYLPPARMMGPRLAEAFAGERLEQVATHAMPSTSPSQLRHNVTVWKRPALPS
jgi:trans-aconitate methyltransferase